MTPYEALFGRKMRALPSLLSANSEETIDEVTLDLFDLELPTDENAASTSAKPMKITPSFEEEETEVLGSDENTFLDGDEGLELRYGNNYEMPEPLTPLTLNIQEMENFQGFFCNFESIFLFIYFNLLGENTTTSLIDLSQKNIASNIELARAGQEKMAATMLRSTEARYGVVEEGVTVRIPIPSVDRSKADPRNVLGVVMKHPENGKLIH
jgi:hypothetical protein